MLKKTLLAAAVASVVSVPAFAKVELEKTADNWKTTTVAAVTKAPVLAFTTADQDLVVNFTENKDLRANGIITLQLTNGATFNAPEVRQWLSKPGAITVKKEGAVTDWEDSKLFKSVEAGVTKYVEHSLDLDNTRLRIALTADENILGDENNAWEIDFKLKNEANNIFNLKKDQVGDVVVAVGAMRDGAYSADPVNSLAMFKQGGLFKLAFQKGAEAGQAQALVATGFTQTDKEQDNISTIVELENGTSRQQIMAKHINLELAGNFSGFKKDKENYFLAADGKRTGLRLVNGAARVNGLNISDIDGQQSGVLASYLTFAIDKDNKDAIEAQKMTLTASISGSSQATFDDFSASIADIFIITRDGLKFDTITTGSTSANTIHIRDVSNKLPKEGGKIYVTIIEYDAHGLNESAESGITPLAERKELSLTLPSGGAVTLSPAGVAADVGAAINPERQARFVFEVETNIGEVAVKKHTSEGIDIQNGSQAEEKNIVDFTL